MATGKILPVSLFYSLAVFSCQRSLYPLYGSVPTGLHALPVICGSTILGFLLPVNSFSIAALVSAIWLALSPRIAYHVGTLTSKSLTDPTLGPIVTNVALLAPLLMVSSFVVRRFTTPGVERISVLTTHTFVILSASRYWAKSSLFNYIDDDKILSALSVLALISWNLTTSFVRPTVLTPQNNELKDKKPQAQIQHTNTVNFSKIATLAIVASLPVLSQVYPATLHPLHTALEHPTAPVRILSSVQSVTGVIVVGETMSLEEDDPRWSSTHRTIQDMRYLRADHSLLGGVWIRNRVAGMDNVNPVATDAEGTRLGDSVYSAFVLQEAVRLVKGRTPKTALTIGLGVGISTQAFQSHGLTTTIVEIDPAVYNAARQYFGLADPGPGNVFIEDARGWVARRRAELPEVTTHTNSGFDIVVHDCFSGGGVPQHIFTIEFWSDLRAIMSREAVLAVNFAGAPASKSSRSILATLEAAFGHCRAFHDYPNEMTEEQTRTEFLNIVFFCSSSGPIEFRESKNADYLNSYLREYIFKGLNGRELDLEIIRQNNVTAMSEGGTTQILSDAQNPLGAWQDQGAMEHWKVMNTVLPSAIWEVY